MTQSWLIILKVHIVFCFYQILTEQLENKGHDFNTQVPSNSLSFEQTQDFQGTDDKGIVNALKSIAYYLRNYKFNERDRRVYKSQPKENLIGFFSGFPDPPLEILHWEVFENCEDSFIKCIAYLQTVIDSASDACVKTEINVKSKTYKNETLIEHESEKRIKSYLDDRSIPFYSPTEKFQWKTTASYYMCWYTMLSIPALSMLSEPCDNFANDLDSIYISQDPRTNNKMSFACATFSFCPDPCCPIKYIASYDECNANKKNPCYIENTFNNLHTKCEMKREDNQNLNGIISNKWNVSCSCKENGLIWSSKYEMCVDVNECADEKHICNIISENCLNSPGSYYCVCKSGFSYNNSTKKCMKKILF